MTPQATLGPALPVTKLSGLSPLPRSSSPPWMTMARPPTKASEASSNDTILSKMTTWVGRLSELATMLPKSPTCLLTSVGAPWFFCNYKVFIKDVWLINLFMTLSTSNGLKCPPASLQPLPNSPFWWTWNPCLPAFKPVNFPLIITVSPVCQYKR